MIGSSTTSDFDETKFADLVLYIAHRCRDDERFGSVKLSKILYYCDFDGLKRLLQPITGATYLKKPKGPFPDGLYRVCDSLVAEGRAKTNSQQVIDYQENRLVPTSDHVELSEGFSVSERQIIDDTIDEMQVMNGTDIANYSHGEFGWQHGEMNQPIPYATALIAREDAPWVTEYLAERNA